jgi:FkbH-like protein
MTIKLFTLSDYTASAIVTSAKKISAKDGVSVEIAGVHFGVRQNMMMPASNEIEGAVALCLPLPEQSLDTFRRRINGEVVSYNEILNEVDSFFDNIKLYFESASTLLLGTWLIPHYSRGLGLLDLQAEIGVKRLIWCMNERLAQRVDKTTGCYLLDTDRWLTQADAGYNSRNYFAAKLPFTNETFNFAGREVAFAINAIAGRSTKLIILDLDNTLWGGVVGDDGWENIKLGGHHSAGEAFVEFQRYLKSLSNRGILLAIASKNDEAVAWEAFEKNPYMVLQKSDFVAWRINWKDKADNISELVSELNLGLQSVLFIDDNSSERYRVKEALPEINVIDLPLSPSLYRTAVENFGCFDQTSLTNEDVIRAKSYLTESKRRSTESQFKSHEEWIKSLELSAEVRPVDNSNIERVVQLFNKTNQLNLSTRKLSMLELADWLEKPVNLMKAVSISDRFGDYGLTGLVSITVQGANAVIIDFILSCRVFGRQVEELMLSIAQEMALENTAKHIRATYLPTSKNKPTLDFFETRSKMKIHERLECNQIVFEADLVNSIDRPKYFRLS